MDWNKTKSIFIVVFLILNIFLYFQYVSVYTQGQQVEVLGEKTIEAKLKDDNITYDSLPNAVENVSYISGKMRNFNDNPLESDSSYKTVVVDDYKAISTFKEPIPLRTPIDEKTLQDFANFNIIDGNKYMLWELDKENRSALFFQLIDNRFLYYNSSGYLEVFWNENNEVTRYEQTMLEKIEQLEQEESTIPPIQVLQALYSRNLLKADSKIKSMDLGYSTLVQLTQTQVFAPTWEVRVENADGEIEEHFVNAFEGKVLDIQKSTTIDEEDIE